MKLVLIILYTNGDHFYLKCKDLVAKGKKKTMSQVSIHGEKEEERVSRG